MTLKAGSYYQARTDRLHPNWWWLSRERDAECAILRGDLLYPSRKNSNHLSERATISHAEMYKEPKG